MAAVGLALVMAGATVYHITRGEVGNILMNIFIAAIVGFVAYQRWKLNPISALVAAGTTQAPRNLFPNLQSE